MANWNQSECVAKPDKNFVATGNKKGRATGLISGRLGHFRGDCLRYQSRAAQNLKSGPNRVTPTWTPELGAPDVSLNFMTSLHVFRWFMVAAIAALLSATVQTAAADR